MEKHKVFLILSKLMKPLYKFILPLTTIISLLLISGNIHRHLFLNSGILDVLARIWLCIMFCMGYLIFSDLEKYKRWFYGGNTNHLTSQDDVQIQVWNIVIGFLLGTFAAIVSWWTIQKFLPSANSYASLLALLNGILFSFPMFFKYRHFRL